MRQGGGRDEERADEMQLGHRQGRADEDKGGIGMYCS